MWRTYLPLLVTAVVAFTSLSNFIKQKFRTYKYSSVDDLLDAGEEAYNQHMNPTLILYNIISVLTVYYIHGFDVLWLYFISLCNYLIAFTFQGSIVTPIFT